LAASARTSSLGKAEFGKRHEMGFLTWARESRRAARGGAGLRHPA
jgi:hypothetical protein